MNDDVKQAPPLEVMKQCCTVIEENLQKLVVRIAALETLLQKAQTDAEAWKTEFIDMQRDKQKADNEIAELRQQLERIYATPPAYNK